MYYSEFLFLLQAHTLLGKLSEVEGFSTKDELFRKHTKPLINSFEDSYIMWNTHTPERLVLDTLLIESGKLIFQLYGCLHFSDVDSVYCVVKNFLFKTIYCITMETSDSSKCNT